MAASRKPRHGDSTIIARKTGPENKITATQILSAAEVRAKKGGRAGESSIILPKDRIRRAGLGVSVKFAMAISIAIAIFMTLFGFVIYNNLKGALNDEIDGAGVLAARALATHELFAWNEFNRAFSGTSYARFEQEISRGEKTIPPDALSDAQKQDVEKRREYNKAILKRLLEKDSRILDALISSPDRSKIVRVASGRPKLDFTGSKVYSVYDVDIEYGTYTPPDGAAQNARSFVAPILDPFGKVEGRATVVLSEASIQEELAKVRMQVLVLALVFIVLGVAVAFVMGQRITSPILSLTRDVETIARGNLDHRPRVMTTDEIGVLARTVDLMARSLAEAQSQEFEHQKQKHQLSVALEIQSNLFPQKLPDVECFEVAAHYHPGPEVGGDYYDAFKLKDGRLCVMVASASGKGIPAAMVTTMARSFISAVAEREDTGPAILKAVNRLLSPDLRRGMYVTALFGILDPKTGVFSVSNAGHSALAVYRNEKKQVEMVHSDGIALGFDKGPVFDRTLQEKAIQLEPLDRVVMCTSGAFDVKNHEGKEIGEEAFYRLVAREAGKTSDAFVKLVAHAIEKYAEAGTIDSDITFVTVKRLA